MLDDLSVLESEDVEADLWPEDVVLGVGVDVVAILEDPDRVDVRALGDGFEQRESPPSRQRLLTSILRPGWWW